MTLTSLTLQLPLRCPVIFVIYSEMAIAVIPFNFSMFSSHFTIAITQNARGISNFPLISGSILPFVIYLMWNIFIPQPLSSTAISSQVTLGDRTLNTYLAVPPVTGLWIKNSTFLNWRNLATSPWFCTNLVMTLRPIENFLNMLLGITALRILNSLLSIKGTRMKMDDIFLVIFSEGQGLPEGTNGVKITSLDPWVVNATNFPFL